MEVEREARQAEVDVILAWLAQDSACPRAYQEIFRLIDRADSRNEDRRDLWQIVQRYHCNYTFMCTDLALVEIRHRVKYNYQTEWYELLEYYPPRKEILHLLLSLKDKSDLTENHRFMIDLYLETQQLYLFSRPTYFHHYLNLDIWGLILPMLSS